MVTPCISTTKDRGYSTTGSTHIDVAGALAREVLWESDSTWTLKPCISISMDAGGNSLFKFVLLLYLTTYSL